MDGVIMEQNEIKWHFMADALKTVIDRLASLYLSGVVDKSSPTQPG